MAHRFDGFSATFVHRGSWKANLYKDKGREFIGVVPVTWTKGNYLNPVTKEMFQRVWYQDPSELERMRRSREPFLVIVALANDYDAFPHSVKHMNAVYRVVPTGDSLEEQTIECKVLERIRADR